MPRFFLLVVLSAALLLPGQVVSAQTTPAIDPGGSVRTRSDLERLLVEYEQALQSPAYSNAVKDRIRADADFIRSRLQNGDFRVGDRITLEVEGEPGIPDTVAVESGPKIVLPLFGDVSLEGVLRSEIEDHLTEALGRFIRDPVVRANGHIRISVQGQIAQPGFYTMPAEMLLGEALMVAGGPTPASDMEDIRIERGPVTVLEGDPLQEAIRSGLTLDQLNLQAGDQIVVPQRPTGGWLGTVGIVTGILGSLTLLILRL
jgi:protein involved in polysaccharide export with SLBB domain